MDENVLNEIKNLSDDDLIALYSNVKEHIGYLQSSLIDTSVDIEGGETEDE
jgi:hypothetical protein